MARIIMDFITTEPGEKFRVKCESPNAVRFHVTVRSVSRPDRVAASCHTQVGDATTAASRHVQELRNG